MLLYQRKWERYFFGGLVEGKAVGREAGVFVRKLLAVCRGGERVDLIGEYALLDGVDFGERKI